MLHDIVIVVYRKLFYLPFCFHFKSSIQPLLIMVPTMEPKLSNMKYNKLLF